MVRRRQVASTGAVPSKSAAAASLYLKQDVLFVRGEGCRVPAMGVRRGGIYGCLQTALGVRRGNLSCLCCILRDFQPAIGVPSFPWTGGVLAESRGGLRGGVDGLLARHLAAREEGTQMGGQQEPVPRRWTHQQSDDISHLFGRCTADFGYIRRIRLGGRVDFVRLRSPVLLHQVLTITDLPSLVYIVALSATAQHLRNHCEVYEWSGRCLLPFVPETKILLRRGFGNLYAS